MKNTLERPLYGLYLIGYITGDRCLRNPGRIPWGPGYRVYFTWRGESRVVLLTGGDKRTQTADIRRALEVEPKVG
jgi:hypothetical protein